MTNVTGKYILNAQGEPEECEDLLYWALWMESADRLIAQSRDERQRPDDPHAVCVSTVFLGLDYGHRRGGPPVLWETMVFGGALDGQTTRYTSRKAALEGHQHMCDRVNHVRRLSAG